jgi:predicted Zn finger-like uncharacterized protein
VRIRCERCATIYELDEKRLPPHGALVKCTRCEHVFRAAPQAPGAPVSQAEERAVGVRPADDEKTSLFGFSAPGGEEHTANIAGVKPPEPAPPRMRDPAPPATSALRQRPSPQARVPKGSRWPWVLLAAVLAALALAASWYAAQSRVATPTTRLPAGVELFPT